MTYFKIGYDKLLYIFNTICNIIFILLLLIYIIFGFVYFALFGVVDILFLGIKDVFYIFKNLIEIIFYFIAGV